VPVADGQRSVEQWSTIMTVIIVIPNQCSDLRFLGGAGGLTPGLLDANERGSCYGRVPMSDCRLFTASLPGCDARHFL
jgi:hypothetical protein